ncbi:MAG: hypothetical protein WKF84_13665 [Pyrinomonadaceae bacterium]
MRYLLPALPALAVAIASSMDSLCAVISPKLRGPSLIAFTCSTITALLISIAWFASQNPLPVVIGREARSDYLSRQLDYFTYYEIIKSPYAVCRVEAQDIVLFALSKPQNLVSPRKVTN